MIQSPFHGKHETRYPKLKTSTGGKFGFRISPPLVYLVLLFSIPLLTGGCPGAIAHERQLYVLEAARRLQPVEIPAEGVLEVRRFSIDTAFATRNLVYRLDEFQYETDHYRQYLISPSVMITERTRDWLAQAGVFERVLPSGSRVAPTHTLEGSITALYGDFTDPGEPVAVMEIRFFLLGNIRPRENVLFAQTYRAATPLRDRTGEAFIEAMDLSLAAILTRLEADLRLALYNLPADEPPAAMNARSP